MVLYKASVPILFPLCPASIIHIHRSVNLLPVTAHQCIPHAVVLEVPLHKIPELERVHSLAEQRLTEIVETVVEVLVAGIRVVAIIEYLLDRRQAVDVVPEHEGEYSIVWAKTGTSEFFGCSNEHFRRVELDVNGLVEGQSYWIVGDVRVERQMEGIIDSMIAVFCHVL